MSACFISKRAIDKDGYPIVNRHGQSMHESRWLYMKHNKVKLKSTDVIMHLCDNRLCVNIEHLKLGTHQDNVADRVSKNRSAKGSKHGRSKLTENDVIVIRKLAKNQSFKSVADLYNVDIKTISNIFYRKSWSHV